MQKEISIILPVYKCEDCLEPLIERLSMSLSVLKKEYEIIFVNDASPDNSWNRLLELSQNNSDIKLINLSRNFGQHAAITAGLANASGEWVVNHNP